MSDILKTKGKLKIMIYNNVDNNIMPLAHYYGFDREIDELKHRDEFLSTRNERSVT